MKLLYDNNVKMDRDTEIIKHVVAILQMTEKEGGLYRNKSDQERRREIEKEFRESLKMDIHKIKNVKETVETNLKETDTQEQEKLDNYIKEQEEKIKEPITEKIIIERLLDLNI